MNNEMNAIIVHGSCDEEEYYSDQYPSLSNSHWLPWMQKQLLIMGIPTQTPEIELAFKPVYDLWKQHFERYPINEGSILIGHSCGGGFLVRWLSEKKVKVNKLILVAPWLDPERRRTTNFFDFTIDRDLQERVNEIHILISDDEVVSGVKESVDILSQAFTKLKMHRFSNMGHFTYTSMGTEKFPELLKLAMGS
jgi:uncharacterized protein